MKENGSLVQKWGMTLFALGFLILFVGMILVMAGSAQQSNVEGSFGGIIFIGPLPIVFGGGPQSPILLVIGLMIAVVMALMFLSTVLSRRKVALEQ